MYPIIRLLWRKLLRQQLNRATILTEAFTRFGTRDFMKKELCNYLAGIETQRSFTKISQLQGQRASEIWLYSNSCCND